MASVDDPPCSTLVSQAGHEPSITKRRRRFSAREHSPSAHVYLPGACTGGPTRDEACCSAWPAETRRRDPAETPARTRHGGRRTRRGRRRRGQQGLAAAAMREIVTLQLGQLGNYLATHFWNAQESYFTYGGQERSPVDHDVHWRAGTGLGGADTFLPRTVVYDLKAGFGSLRRANGLYEDASAAAEDAAAADALWHVFVTPPLLPFSHLC